MTRHSNQLILLLLLAVLGACSTTQVQESWRLPGYQPSQPQKILVVTLASRETLRKAFEQSFVNELEQRGITAAPSLQWIADGTRLTRDALVPIVQQNGFTTVLVTSIRDVQKSQTYQPDNSGEMSDGLFRNIDTYYAYSSNGQHEGGSYAQLTEFLIETNLFQSSNRKLSWSITTRTSATDSIQKSIDDIVKSVLSQAKKDNVL